MSSTFLLYLFLLKSEYKIRHRRQLNSRVGKNPDFFLHYFTHHVQRIHRGRNA